MRKMCFIVSTSEGKLYQLFAAHERKSKIMKSEYNRSYSCHMRETDSLGLTGCSVVLQTEYLCPHKIHMLKPNGQCDGIRSDSIMKVDCSWMESLPYRRESGELPHAFHHIWTHQEVSNLKCRRGPSPESDHASTLILDYNRQNHETWLPVVWVAGLWYFVTVAWTRWGHRVSGSTDQPSTSSFTLLWDMSRCSAILDPWSFPYCGLRWLMSIS